MLKMKNDMHRKKRGGRAKIFDVYCSNCDSYILTYQKDGKGRLHRLYLNRILSPENIEKKQHKHYSSIKDISNLVCDSCNVTLAIPMLHHDGRFAYRLIQGSFYKKKHAD